MQARQVAPGLGLDFSDVDDACFIRTEDIVCLMCTNGDSSCRGFLAAEGFGSQMCHLEPEPRVQEPCELQKCIFKLEDSMSVHAMYTNGLSSNKQHSSCKILMYGHAILLRHLGTKELLCSLTTSPENDKMAYNVGFNQSCERASSSHVAEECCWFRILPASNQRSEGEKVRAGDDIFLVNVANERYLSALMSGFQTAESESSASKQLNSVRVSFHQCVWSLHIVCSGSAKEAAIGNVNGGDVVRFIHRFWGGDTLMVRSSRPSRNATLSLPENFHCDVQYEKLTGSHELSSLWRVELFQMKYGGGFTSWGQPFRLRHLVTGRFLGVKLEKGNELQSGSSSPGKNSSRKVVALLSPSEASDSATAFRFVKSATKLLDHWTRSQVSGMGVPEIHFGDSEVYVQHINSELYLGCAVSERRHTLRQNSRKALMQKDFNQSFAFTMTRASAEQAKAASIIQLTESIMRNYAHKVLLSRELSGREHLEKNLSNILKALIQYFEHPKKSELTHDQYQQQLYHLRERQNLFKKQGMLKFTLTMIIETAKNIKRSSKNQEIVHSLYKLLAAMIRGNHDNCCEFATQRWLGVFMKQLSMPEVTHHVLTVIQCLLADSPEVLNIFSESDIGIIVNLLNTNGRDNEVMKLLSSLCVCHEVAMRDKQKLIYKHLLKCNDLLVQTSQHATIHCLHPDLYIGIKTGSAAYTKWYYEVQVTQFHINSSSSSSDFAARHIPHLRIGWAHPTLFRPRPSSNGNYTLGGGVGDDMYSMSFDGNQVWMGGNPIVKTTPPPTPSTLVRHLKRQEEVVSPEQTCDSSSSDTPIAVGDVIGCCINLEEKVAWFIKNGRTVNTHLKFYDWNDMVTPAVSFSSGVSIVMSFGGSSGNFSQSPPPRYAGLYEAIESNKMITLVPFCCQGDTKDLLVAGPPIMTDFESFVPAPIDTSKVSLPDSISSSYGYIKDLLAENIHEVWSKNKIDAGFSYAEERDDHLKHSPYLKPFQDLDDQTSAYDYDMALKTLKTLVTLGYQITVEQQDISLLKYQELPPEKYQMGNGYIPQPLDLEAVNMPDALRGLIDKLAENAHNIWAVERIKEGWTYGKADDSHTKRNPLLVPYSKLSSAGKKSNHDTAYECVRTVLALGCTIIPPSSGGRNIDQLMREFSKSNTKTTTFRGQKCYKVMDGKWYYEVKLLTGGMMRIGWAMPSLEAGKLLGSDSHSYAYDGHLSRKWHNESENFGKRWSEGDVVGCLLDMESKTICFSLNGELLYDSQESSIAFDKIDTSQGFVPAITLSAGEKAMINFGHSTEELKHFVFFEGSGYTPLCTPCSLQYNIPLWYSSHGGFNFLDNWNSQNKFVSEQKNTSISVLHSDWDYSSMHFQECFRLNIGFTINPLGSPVLPTLLPRPGVLSPSPTVEGFSFTLDSEATCPETYAPLSFSAIFPAGQVPSLAFIGWTTPSFQFKESHFTERKREESCSCSPREYSGQHVEVCDAPSKRKSSSDSSPEMSFQTAFMVCLSDLLPTFTQQLTAPVRVQCMLELSSGRISFSTDQPPPSDGDTVTEGKREVTFTAHVGTKLFPTVVVTPSTKNAVDFDFTPGEKCTSLSSHLITPIPPYKGSKTPEIPLCPPRFKLMGFSKSLWVRQNPTPPNYHVTSAVNGSLTISTEKELEYSILVTLPQEDLVMDIIEISEDLKLMDFHIQTIEAFCAVCSHSNLSLAKSITQFIDSEQLMKCLQLSGMRYELRAAYLKLISYLHLEHEVQTRLLMRGEFVLPRSEFNTTVPLFTVPLSKEQHKDIISEIPYLLKRASLPGQHLQDLSRKHNISSRLSQRESMKSFAIGELKELVLGSLEDLLCSQYYKMYLLPVDSRSPVFVPMIKAMDDLLVVGALNQEHDFQRVLHLLDPLEFTLPTSEKQFEEGLLHQDVSNEEPIKLAICSLLQHLCDCQVRHRVEAVVSFANSYVEELQKEQQERYKKNFKKKPKEFRSSSEVQVEGMLATKSDYSSCSKKLHDQLKHFTKDLQLHCGVLPNQSHDGQELSSWEKLEKLGKLVSSIADITPSQNDASNGRNVVSFQGIITRTMVKWASNEIQDLKLIDEIFSLLYRQFNEVHEVVQALKKTYVLEVVTDPKTGRPNFDIQAFCNALGSLKLLLKVGMSKKEENLLKDSLNTINHSNLFYCHPSLLHRLEVYSTVLKLMKTYLGISGSGSATQHFLAARRRLHLDLCVDGTPMPIDMCCRFLCNFAKINQENQRALFKHIDYLLEHAEKYPGLLSCNGYTPLDVATATIKDNPELALALEDSHLEYVVQLLVATTTGMKIPDDSDTESPTSTMRRYNTCAISAMQRYQSSSFDEWAPNGGGKCLEFLQSAVWVENEQIQENAYIIVQQLVHHSECLGPALTGKALGLYNTYNQILGKKDDVENMVYSQQSTVGTCVMEDTSRKQQSYSNPSSEEEAILTFYTCLLRLLAYCASRQQEASSSSMYSSSKSSGSLGQKTSGSASRHKQSVIARTRNILQNLIKAEEIVYILSIASTEEKGRVSSVGLRPFHKEAALLFLDRVYGIPSPDTLLLKLLTEAFLPDIKLALILARDSEDSLFCATLNRYICCSIFPFLGRSSGLSKLSNNHLIIIDNFLVCCFRLFSSSNLSSTQLDEFVSFFTAVLKDLHPRTIQKFMPKILANLTKLQPHTIIFCKLLSSHYDHFSRYYQSGLLDKTSHGVPTEEEKTCSALVVYRLLDSLASKLTDDPHLLRAAISCLKSISRALCPSCLIPSQSCLSSLYLSSSLEYVPQPLDTSSVVLSANLRQVVDEFANYQHASWVFDWQVEGWVYGPVQLKEKHQHPNIRPYRTLDQSLKEKMRKPVEEAIKYLRKKGWNFSKVSPMNPSTVPLKQKTLCLRKPRKKKDICRELTLEEEYSTYEPDVHDLSKVELKFDLLSLAEQMAEQAHDLWAAELRQNDSNCDSHPYFCPYELIDEEKKEELRNFSLDLLRYMRFAGFEPSKLHPTLSMRSMSELEQSSNHEKFSLQLFKKFLDFLSTTKIEIEFYLKVLFPVVTSYMQKYAGYFMPSNDMQASSTTASKEEKLIILKLFCKVTEFTRKNLDMFFPSVKKPSAKVLSPSSLEGLEEANHLADTDKSWLASKCILSLLQSFIQSMDIKSIAGETNSLSDVCHEIVDFFRQATTGIKLTAENIANMDTLDSQFHFYCLQLLIPSLTILFKHVGLRKVSHLLINGAIQGHCRYIFINLVEMATGTGPVFVGSSPLVTIGQCMGAFALAYPNPFLHDEQFGFNMASLLDQLHNATAEATTCGNILFVVDIIIPVLASYIARWWSTDHLHFGLGSNSQDMPQLVNETLVNILTLLASHFGEKEVKWFPRVIESSVLLASKCSMDILRTHIVPMMEEMRERGIGLWNEEYYFSSTWNYQLKSYEDESRVETQEALTEVMEESYRIFVRDLTSLLPFLSIFIDSKNKELRSLCSPPNRDKDLCESIQTLFISLTDIFHCWSCSQYFRREFQTSIHHFAQQTQYHLALTSANCMDYLSKSGAFSRVQVPGSSRKQSEKLPNFILLCLEVLLPVADALIDKEDRGLLETCTSSLGMKGVITEDLKAEIVNKLKSREMKSQKLAHKLVKQFSSRFISPPVDRNRRHEEKALRIVSLATIKHKVQQAEKGRAAQTRWRQVLSQRKRKAVISCFLAVPFFKLTTHRAVNLFLGIYCKEWLMNAEQTTHQMLTEELLDHQDYLAVQRIKENDLQPRHKQKQLSELEPYTDPLSQLFKMFKRVATTERQINESLYIAYADVLGKSVIGQSDDDEPSMDDDPTGAYEVYTEEKAELVAKQLQLAEREAPTTILNVITASNGEKTGILHSTLLLGIALLKEGNQKIQDEMLRELNTMDVGFLSSISKLISTCSVLNWNAYERYNKSEIIQSTNSAVCKVLPDFGLTISLFRFLQLLCEGHNLSFQNYLRTQAGNTTTVNIIVYTVDYLLRMQESISDFYWHYSDYQTIDLQGREHFLKAFKVAKQVFRTLTEYIQGPCVKNQDTLACSRLWDAVSGFIHIFAVLQRKLYKDTSQMELLRELLGLQEEMFVLLLSMLEGSTMSSTTGKLMMDTLMESVHYIEDIMAFFSIFVKLKDSTTSKAFKEYDLNKDGFISYREFEKAMEAQQRYTKEEIAFLMECADLNHDGLLDYLEFTERFHQPAENIGFHLCVLIVHLTDHLPNDKRVERLKAAPQSKELLEHFEKNMGCIEILGKSGRIERVYFEVKDTRMKQWDEAQIVVSRRNFLHSVEMGSQKNKLKGFMSFCDETIFEMNYCDKISGSVQSAMEVKAIQHRREHNKMLQPQPFISRVRASVNAFQEDHTSFRKLLLWLQIVWTFILLKAWPLIRSVAHLIWGKFSLAFASVKSYFHRKWSISRKNPIITTSAPSSSTPSTSTGNRIKNVKRPPSLQINYPPQGPIKLTAKTTTTPKIVQFDIHTSREGKKESNVESTLRKRTASLIPTAHMRAPVVDESRRESLQLNGASVQPGYTRGISVGNGETYTPRVFKNKPLDISYNRSNMKRPSVMITDKTPTNEGSTLKFDSREDSYIPKITAQTKSWPFFLARNYYNLNNIKLCVTFLINIILLMFQVTSQEGLTILPDNSTINLIEPNWTPLLLQLCSILHFLLSAILIVAYFYLKIPLVIFKREKMIAQQLEEHHLWVTGKPLETWREWWDQIVVGANTFPRNYWNKRVKQRIYESFAGDSRNHVAKVLGMEVKSKFEKRTRMEQIMETLHSLVDIRYCIWTIGVTLSHPVSLYHILYCILSFIGLKWNFFYFSIHLIDFVMNFKLLRTVLKSVLHNGKQLGMTLLMMCVVIYIYTVLAFNFFRKFYLVETGGVQIYKCDSMMECFIYHIDQGLRSGGGIADVLESASGDPNEFLRLCFDITFFFFVVVILLAIIQGLIIDAFGELRDKEETLTNEMQTKCFVCGLPKGEFDHIPHGFDNHVTREHNMAYYMFFLMHLIKKKESEFSGQESYVWEKYLQQSVDFFPVGDCFHSQEERTLAAAKVASEGHGSIQMLTQKKPLQQKQAALKKSHTVFM